MDKFNPSIRIGKKDDSSDICGIIVGSRQAGLSFSETVTGIFPHSHFWILGRQGVIMSAWSKQDLNRIQPP